MLGRDGENAGLLEAREIAMRLARRLALLLLPIALAVAPIAIGRTAESSVATDSLRGQLLVAEPELDDPNFDHTVVLLLRHSTGGAQGVVLNRPYGTAPTAELLRRLGQKGDGVQGETRLFYGGPVQPEVGVVLHGTDYALADTRQITADLAVTSNPAVLKDLATGRGPRQALPILGYAGWGPGQLESELAQGAWFTIAPDPALIFTPEPRRMWERALARKGVEL